MKGSSSSALTHRLTVAFLILLIHAATGIADEQVVCEKPAGKSPSEPLPTDEGVLSQEEEAPSPGRTDDGGRWMVRQTPPRTDDKEDRVSTEPPKFCLSGRKYWDKNQNGERDPEEGDLSGWTITVDGESTTWWTVTNIHGYWKICNLSAGTYYISERPPKGEIGWISSRRPAKVTITDRSIKDLNSGNYRALHDEPRQYEQFCESQLVTGSGYLDVKNSVLDKKLAMDYQNKIFGEGDIGLESAQVYSQEPNKLRRPIPNCSDPNGTTMQRLNFFDNTKVVYEGETPLVGSRSIRSIERYGGIGADIHENFSVRRMEADQTVFLGTTSNSTIRRTVGSNTQNSFEGMWGTDSRLHKIFYKDIKRRERFSGDFEVLRELKFHENPVAEPGRCPCGGVDC